ncbi:HAD family hydrolase [Paraburkholderia bonniea]|uniref:HAD family hydrolase n=1 Tax=Paraburkholderia bonniea TaxID=2152891 RepID=UPI0012923154|nr:HAD family hydrolase [Paraburkholderia bonniea]WJF90732.1 HAD family hydrolase [Paraburkholderia bonniea]WJF94046.1 HAD family hydrolase [Paraburkholderia bonniea]
MLDHLICDCDGVLVDSEIIADHVLLDTLSTLFPGHDFAPAVKTAFGQQTSSFLKKLEASFNLTLPADFLDTIERRVAEALATSLSPIHGVREALLQIPLPAAVVSNSEMARVLTSVQRAGLSEIFAGRIFSAAQVARPKPHPDVYLFAAQQLGVAAARCLVVEDSLSGLSAARAAGMQTIAFVGASHIPEGYTEVLRKLGITRIIDRMDTLPALVAAGMRGEFGGVQS